MITNGGVLSLCFRSTTSRGILQAGFGETGKLSEILLKVREPQDVAQADAHELGLVIAGATHSRWFFRPSRPWRKSRKVSSADFRCGGGPLITSSSTRSGVRMAQFRQELPSGQTRAPATRKSWGCRSKVRRSVARAP